MQAAEASRKAAEEEARKQREKVFESGVNVGEAEKKQYVEKFLPDLNEKGENGQKVGDIRRTQIKMLTGPNSAIMGIFRNEGSDYKKARNLVIDIAAGSYAGKDGDASFAEAIKGLSIKDADMNALKAYQQMTTEINPLTLKANAGEGPKSDADMTINSKANMTNIGDIPAYAALTGLNRSQFSGDLAKNKLDFAAGNRDKYQSETALNQAWSKEKDKLNRQYTSIYEDRLKYIDGQMVQKFGKDWRKRPNDETQGFYRDASIHSFNVYPTPNYNATSGQWDYPTQQSKLSAMRAITGRK